MKISICSGIADNILASSQHFAQTFCGGEGRVGENKIFSLSSSVFLNQAFLYSLHPHKILQFDFCVIHETNILWISWLLHYNWRCYHRGFTIHQINRKNKNKARAPTSPSYSHIQRSTTESPSPMAVCPWSHGQFNNITVMNVNAETILAR
jgi:hypothetical protein